jgi:hypothetical protein
MCNKVERSNERGAYVFWVEKQMSCLITKMETFRRNFTKLVPDYKASYSRTQHYNHIVLKQS